MPKIIKPKKAKTVVVKETPSKKVMKTAGLTIDVYAANGTVKKSMELPKEIFSVEASPKLLAQYVRVYLANQRQGTISTKTRSEVAGTTKKIYRQKGTGRARHGAKKASLFVGGGVTFGPQPRDFSLKMNKKQKKKALFYSLSLKAKEKAVVGIVSEAVSMHPKTRTVVKLFSDMGVENDKVLLVLPSMDNNLHLAARNLPHVEIVSYASLNAYSIINHKKIVFTEDAVNSMVAHFIHKDEK